MESKTVEVKKPKLIAFKNLYIVFGLVILATSIALGFVIGFFSADRSSDDSTVNYYKTLISDVDIEGLKHIEKIVSRDMLKNHLKEMTKIPHMAGTVYDKISADYVRDTFISYGLDEVELSDYDVLLDYPNDIKYNNVEIKNSQGVEKLYEIKEASFYENFEQVSKPFLAYSNNGTATSDKLFYVNYCMEEDFEQLKKATGQSVQGAIVMCRYGKIFRGNKIEIAELHGASGVLLFDDPLRAAPTTASQFVFPNGEFLPGDGTQRGTLFVYEGDPLTPYYPSNDYVYRKNQKDLETLPKIQAQVIGYNVALELFKLIENNNNQVIDAWKGQMNVKYSYGGALSSGRSISVNVFNHKEIKKTYNVMGLIKGTVEEDRYVIIGNHRDAWTWGTLDPTSGTTVLLELARVLMKMKNENLWKPKRSVLFMSWGAEEYGLIGSVEWVEEYQKKLFANAVVYLNIDTVLKGNYSYRAIASPLMFDFLFDVTKSIKVNANENVFERWLKNDNPGGSVPKVSPYLGAASDHMSFVQRLGLPSVEQSYIRNRENPLFKTTEVGSYPSYHSSYELFELVEKFLDPNYETFRLITVIVAELLRRLSEHLVLPFNAVTYSQVLENEFNAFEKEYIAELSDIGINLDHMKWAVSNFSKSAKEFHKRLDNIDREKFHMVRMYNEQLRNVEKSFLDFNNNLVRRGYNHMIFAPSISNAYGNDVFPSITDAIFNYKKSPNSNELKENIKMQFAMILHSIYQASSILKEPCDFKRYIY